MLAGKEYAGVAYCSGCGSHKWTYANECQVCERAGCSECMEVRYLLRCGSHWDGITFGHGCEWVVSVDFANATRFDSEAAAHSMKQRLELRPYSAIHTVVVTLVCESCKVVDEFTFRLNEGNVGRHTTQRLDSFVDAVVGKRITYKKLIGQVA